MTYANTHDSASSEITWIACGFWLIFYDLSIIFHVIHDTENIHVQWWHSVSKYFQPNFNIGQWLHRGLAMSGKEK